MKLGSRFELDSAPVNTEIEDCYFKAPFGNESDGNSIPKLDSYYGWAIVFMSSLVMFIVYGTVYSYGILLLHYIDAGVGGRTALSFIPTISLSLNGIMSIITGNMDTQFGHRWCIFIGGIGCAGGMFLSSFATETWQLILTQGVMMGTFGSLASIAALSAPLQWFEKSQGLACGLTLAGSGIGGLALPPLFRYILPKLGIKWTLCSYSVFILVVLVFASFIIKERIPLKKKGLNSPEGQRESWSFGLKFLFDLTLFKDMTFLGLFSGVFISSMGLVAPVLMIGPYASAKGIDPNKVPNLISLLNGCSAAGRIVLGSLGDRVGPINMLNTCMLCISMSCLLIWSMASSYTTLLIFSGIYGFSMGGFVSMPPVIASELFFHKGIAKVNGLLLFGMGIPTLISAPIASALVDIVSYQSDPTGEVKNYLPAILYSGLTSLLSFICFIYMGFRVRLAARRQQPPASSPR